MCESWRRNWRRIEHTRSKKGEIRGASQSVSLLSHRCKAPSSVGAWAGGQGCAPAPPRQGPPPVGLIGPASGWGVRRAGRGCRLACIRAGPACASGAGLQGWEVRRGARVSALNSGWCTCWGCSVAPGKAQSGSTVHMPGCKQLACRFQAGWRLTIGVAVGEAVDLAPHGGSGCSTRRAGAAEAVSMERAAETAKHAVQACLHLNLHSVKQPA